jgi:hypothetical protein
MSGVEKPGDLHFRISKGGAFDAIHLLPKPEHIRIKLALATFPMIILS